MVNSWFSTDLDSLSRRSAITKTLETNLSNIVYPWTLHDGFDQAHEKTKPEKGDKMKMRGEWPVISLSTTKTQPIGCVHWL